VPGVSLQRRAEAGTKQLASVWYLFISSFLQVATSQPAEITRLDNPKFFAHSGWTCVI